MRAMYIFSGPIEVDGERYATISDRPDDQENHYQEFMKKVFDKYEDEDTDFFMKLFSFTFFDYLINFIVSTDFYWTIASFLFVWAYVTFHL